MSDDSVRMKLIRRLQFLASEHDCWWTSPKGKLCQICSGGLYVPETKSAIAWGDVKYIDLLEILKDNETHISKGEMISRNQAGYPVKKTKYVPKYTPEFLYKAKAKLIEEAQRATWEELPPASPEPPPPDYGDDVPF